tara:strand:+ start:5714 stop:5974 length:261 start_codon:yes stop_codon:yes gene_type:complete
MNKYSKTPQQLQKERTLIYSTGDYPLMPHDPSSKKDGRIIDTGINFVCHFADGSDPIPCRKLKDALLYVNLVSIDKMPQDYQNRFQ